MGDFNLLTITGECLLVNHKLINEAEGLATITTDASQMKAKDLVVINENMPVFVIL